MFHFTLSVFRASRFVSRFHDSFSMTALRVYRLLSLEEGEVVMSLLAVGVSCFRFRVSCSVIGVFEFRALDSVFRVLWSSCFVIASHRK